MVNKIICDFCGKEIDIKEVNKEFLYLGEDGKDSCNECHNKIKLITEKYKKEGEILKNNFIEEVNNLHKEEFFIDKQKNKYEWWRFWKR